MDYAKGHGRTFWLDKSEISRHMKNIFNTGELGEEVVVAFLATTTWHGAMEGSLPTSETRFYNFDAVISVGYRVNSKKAPPFRIWATKVFEYSCQNQYHPDYSVLKLPIIFATI